MKHKSTATFELGSISSEAADSPFTLPVRMPGWYPDGIVSIYGETLRVFPEELIGLDKKGMPIPYKPEGFPKKQSKSKSAHHSKSSSAPSGKQTKLMQLMGKIKVHARRYNASLYYLRWLHYRYRFKELNGITTPEPNSHGHPKNDINPHDPVFPSCVSDAEEDWKKVNRDFSDLIDYAQSHGLCELRLLGVEMTTNNGYITHIRVVAIPLRERRVKKYYPLEIGGSSSQDSLDSAFSSS